MVLGILQYQFFQNAIIVAVLASVAAGIIGTYIVIKRMSLISGSIAHTAFGGLGISYYLGLNPLMGAAFFSLLASTGVAFFRKRAANRMDTLLSAIWATGMAVGLVFIFLTPGYATDLFTYLFGNILLVSSFDLMLITALDLVIVVMVLLLYNSFLAVVFDEEYAEVRNVPVSALYFVLFGLVALTVVMMIKVVGIILMIALLTMPAATAQLFNRTVKGIMFLASIITLFSTLTGLFLSYLLNFPTGPVIVLITAFVYVCGMFYSHLGHKKAFNRSRPYP